MRSLVVTATILTILTLQPCDTADLDHSVCSEYLALAAQNFFCSEPEQHEHTDEQTDEHTEHIDRLCTEYVTEHAHSYNYESHTAPSLHYPDYHFIDQDYEFEHDCEGDECYLDAEETGYDYDDELVDCTNEDLSDNKVCHYTADELDYTSGYEGVREYSLDDLTYLREDKEEEVREKLSALKQQFNRLLEKGFLKHTETIQSLLDGEFDHVFLPTKATGEHTEQETDYCTSEEYTEYTNPSNPYYKYIDWIENEENEEECPDYSDYEAGLPDRYYVPTYCDIEELPDQYYPQNQYPHLYPAVPEQTEENSALSVLYSEYCDMEYTDRYYQRSDLMMPYHPTTPLPLTYKQYKNLAVPVHNPIRNLAVPLHYHHKNLALPLHDTPAKNLAVPLYYHVPRRPQYLGISERTILPGMEDVVLFKYEDKTYGVQSVKELKVIDYLNEEEEAPRAPVDEDNQGAPEEEENQGEAEEERTQEDVEEYTDEDLYQWDEEFELEF